MLVSPPPTAPARRLEHTAPNAEQYPCTPVRFESAFSSGPRAFCRSDRGKYHYPRSARIESPQRPLHFPRRLLTISTLRYRRPFLLPCTEGFLWALGALSSHSGLCSTPSLPLTFSISSGEGALRRKEPATPFCYCPISLLTFTTQLERLLLISLLFDFICPWLIIQRWNLKGRASRPLSAPALHLRAKTDSTCVFFRESSSGVCISQTAAEVQTALHWRRTSWKSTCCLWLLTNFYPILPFCPSHTTEAAFSQGLETTLVPSSVLPPLSDQAPPGPTVQPLPYLLLQSLLFVPLTLPSLGLSCHLAKPLQ